MCVCVCMYVCVCLYSPKPYIFDLIRTITHYDISLSLSLSHCNT